MAPGASAVEISRPVRCPARLLSRMCRVVSPTLAIRWAPCGPYGRVPLRPHGRDVNQSSQNVAEEQVPARRWKSSAWGFISSSMFVLGSLLGNFIPMHPFALMILAVAFIKVSGVLPRRYEQAAADWYQFVVTNLTPSLLVGIGVAYTSIPELINAFSISYFVLVLVTVVGGALGAALVGRMIGFYPIEAAITGGLCRPTWGTGDVAVLSAAHRMKPMPFAQIFFPSRGCRMLILATLLISLLDKERQ